MEPGAHQVVGRSLARGVGAPWVVPSGFVEWFVVGSERAEHFVRRYMVEAERRPAGGRQLCVIPPRFLQQDERTDDVGLDEIGGTIDGAINVALGGKVHE